MSLTTNILGNNQFIGKDYFTRAWKEIPRSEVGTLPLEMPNHIIPNYYRPGEITRSTQQYFPYPTTSCIFRGELETPQEFFPTGGFQQLIHDGRVPLSVNDWLDSISQRRQDLTEVCNLLWSKQRNEREETHLIPGNHSDNTLDSLHSVVNQLRTCLNSWIETKFVTFDLLVQTPDNKLKVIPGSQTVYSHLVDLLRPQNVVHDESINDNGQPYHTWGAKMPLEVYHSISGHEFIASEYINIQPELLSIIASQQKWERAFPNRMSDIVQSHTYAKIQVESAEYVAHRNAKGPLARLVHQTNSVIATPIIVDWQAGNSSVRIAPYASSDAREILLRCILTQVAPSRHNAYSLDYQI